jgi:hypothetical protein
MAPFSCCRCIMPVTVFDGRAVLVRKSANGRKRYAGAASVM